MSVWAGIKLMVKPQLLIEGVVDDITLLGTFTIDRSTRSNFGISPLKWAAAGTDYSDSTLLAAIRACHGKKIQILAGVDFAHKKADGAVAFNAWLQYLDGLSPGDQQQRITDAAKDLAGLLAKNYDTSGGSAIFDGIGFDIEYYDQFTPADSTGDLKLAALMTLFYNAVTDAIKANHQICAPAIGSLIADYDPNNRVGVRGVWVQPYYMARGPFSKGVPFAVKKTGEQDGAPTAIDYQPNMILRPMGYDAFPFTRLQKPLSELHPDKVLEWHEKIVTYALTQPTDVNQTNVPGVLPRQFQLGIKTAPGSGNLWDADPPSPAAPAAPASPASPELPTVDSPPEPAPPAGAAAPPAPPKVLTKNDAVVSSKKWLRKTARMLRSHNVGLILFAFPGGIDSRTLQLKPDSELAKDAATFWTHCSTYNFILNATTLPPDSFDDAGVDPSYDPADPSKGTLLPGLKDGPLQCPMDDAALKRLSG